MLLRKVCRWQVAFLGSSFQGYEMVLIANALPAMKNVLRRDEKLSIQVSKG